MFAAVGNANGASTTLAFGVAILFAFFFWMPTIITWATGHNRRLELATQAAAAQKAIVDKALQAALRKQRGSGLGTVWSRRDTTSTPCTEARKGRKV